MSDISNAPDADDLGPAEGQAAGVTGGATRPPGATTATEEDRRRSHCGARPVEALVE